VPADAEDMAESIVCDTFLRFKGLERPAVIVTDLGGVASRRREVRLHIALTRALDLVRIVGEEAPVRDDPVLRMLVSSSLQPEQPV
jgi:superfamily I DNA and RNA helicase